MDFITATIYGFIQGFSEFLPISSSGHLALLPFVMKLNDPGVVFDLCMHGGTALAVVVYFRKDLMSMMKAFCKLIRREELLPHENYVKNFILSTIASVFLILILRPFSKNARSAEVIMFNQIAFGLLLWGADFYQNRLKSIRTMKDSFDPKASVLIGLSQALAIFPGVSRSGITMTSGLFYGLKKEEASRFSFLLSLPIIFAGILLELIKLLKEGTDTLSLGPTLLGVVVSFFIGLFTIHFFLLVFTKISLKWFCFYRIILAALIAWLLYA